ncbi:serum amyloid A-4 protein-like isoform X2 [Nannospalax galili]|uniref:Serum amyloid A protein n=2 Tax=Nannospalax galili TaxID=1026970 RepID=A0A8C6W7A2_NANGA|nr:serum amyloid A-4 protein-like isoform X2 [Nannospalax galili]
MRLGVAMVFCSLVMGVSSEGWYSFFKEAVQGAGDLWRAYWDMREANYQNSDRYFYARGNYEAAQRGSGGIWAAKIISTARKYFQGLLNQYYFGISNHGSESMESTRKAEEWGRSGKHPNHFRPQGLPEKF